MVFEVPAFNASLLMLLKRLWGHISPKRRIQFKGLFFLMILASIAEVISISAVIPFLGIIAQPERVLQNSTILPLIEFLHFPDSSQLLFLMTIIFIFVALISGLMRLVLLWVQTNLGHAICADLSLEFYRRTLYQPYSFHLLQNSSEMIAGITGKSSMIVHQILLPVLTILSSFLMLISIMGALLVIQPAIAVTAFLSFGFIYAFIVFVSKKALLHNSHCVNIESSRVIKALQEGLGGIRDVLLDGSQAVYCDIYQKADLPMRRAHASITIISAGPRYLIEALGMALIASLAYSMSDGPEGYAASIPVLGALALGAQRLLPILQQAYASWSSMRSAQSSLIDVLDTLDKPLPTYLTSAASSKIVFTRSISLCNVSFSYSKGAPTILKDINLNIRKGSRIGFIGSTGSGKSTILDVIMALLEPTKGALMVDGEVVAAENARSWQEHIAHVPQVIFLADATIAENIAFGVPLDKIDYTRVQEAAQKAQISSAIDSWGDRYNTIVGERGLRLSGGQRQRIGIARALYKNADIYILDEATSALDNDTESSVMASMDSMADELTFIIVAHRLTSLKGCDQIIEIKNGSIGRIGTYEEIIGIT
jgi:ABC-type multidrug transport system fused ATPase/permease subunit